MLETHIGPLLYVSASATSAYGYVQQGFLKVSNNQRDSFEQGVCCGKAGPRSQEDALLYCMAMPAPLLLQRAEPGANVLVGR